MRFVLAEGPSRDNRLYGVRPKFLIGFFGTGLGKNLYSDGILNFMEVPYIKLYGNW
jgi:hypothetical protein